MSAYFQPFGKQFDVTIMGLIVSAYILLKNWIGLFYAALV